MVLRLRRGAREKLSTHFNSEEFDCHCKNRDCDSTLVDTNLIANLEVLRNILGGIKLAISSGYRCEKHNKAIGGELDSQHTYGKAADLVSATVKPKVIADATELVPGFVVGGVGRYPSFTHVDVRSGKARWGSNG
jgi:uncharacterized protein YcbK (DUF882 family)